jgi:glycosyltransferase involved in cell wall biosynthesis
LSAVRIVFTIHHALDLDSGAPGITMLLSRALAERGHEVSLLSFDDLPRVDERARALMFPLFVDRHLRKLGQKVDIVDASTGDAWIWAFRRHRHPALVTRSHGLEHIVHDALVDEVRRGHLSVSRRYPLYHGGLRLRQVTISLRRADAVAFLNRDERTYAIEHLGVDAAKAVVIPHGLPNDLAGRTPAAHGTSSPGIAQIGSYQWRKGITYARDSLTEVLRKHPDAHAHLLGTGVAREAVLADYPEDVRERVNVVPMYERSELAELLAECRIALFPSLAEGFPLGLIESMACGLAPVTTAIPGPRDIVRDGVDGLVVPPADPRALAMAIDQLLGDHDLLHRLRNGALARAQAYTWSNTLDATEALYTSAVAGKP